MRLKQLVVSLAAASAASLALAASASAAPTGDYAQFAHCPVGNAQVVSCLYSEVTSGSFKLGTSTVPINKKIVLQGGFYYDANFNIVFVNAVGADTLSKTGLDVPGGLLGIMQGSGFTGALLAAFEAAVHSFNGVTATAELVGPPQLNLINFIIQSGSTLTMPVRIHLENPFLGSNCYIGSSSSPVTLAMTSGTTAPPPPNTPISGSVGNTSTSPDGAILQVSGFKLVNNSFSVPAASGCGYWPFVSLITAAVNLKEALPSASGNNAAIFNGNQNLTAKDEVINHTP
ncbi:MAG: hypothetical protein ABW167_20195 [Baekduia sp.]